jgi:hypothetical protein
MARRARTEPDVVRITDAPISTTDEIDARQRRYLLSMGLRTLCFVGAIVVGSGWLRWVLVAGALVLPYVAVVMANAATTKGDGFALLDHGAGHHELESPTQGQ